MNTPVRVMGLPETAGHLFHPLPYDHPLVGEVCLSCEQRFLLGDRLTIVPLGPGSDPERQGIARRGGAYTANGVPVHAACVGVQE